MTENFLPLQVSQVHVFSKGTSSTKRLVRCHQFVQMQHICVEVSSLWMLQKTPGSVFHLPLNSVSRNNSDKNTFVFTFYSNAKRIGCDFRSSAATWPRKINFLMSAPELLSSEPRGRLDLKKIGVGLYNLWFSDYQSFTFRIALYAFQLLIPSKDNPLIVGSCHENIIRPPPGICVFQKRVT